MSDSWDERRKAQEEQFFEKENERAIKKLQAEKDSHKPRLSPASGKAMTHTSIAGVTVYRCPDSGGIWLESGQLEAIVNNTRESDDSNWLANFFNTLFSTNK